jgi:hypothetical protein
VGPRTKISVAYAVWARERPGKAALLVILAMADQDDVPRHGATVGVLEVSALVQRRQLVGRRVADELLHPVRRSVGVLYIQLPDRIGVVAHRILMLQRTRHLFHCELAVVPVAVPSRVRCRRYKALRLVLRRQVLETRRIRLARGDGGLM